MKLTRLDFTDSGNDYCDDGEYVAYEDIEPLIRLYDAVKQYGFPDGTKAGDDIADILVEVVE